MIDDKFGMPINYIQMGGSRWFNAERTLTKVPMRPDYMERNAFHRQNLAVNLGKPPGAPSNNARRVASR